MKPEWTELAELTYSVYLYGNFYENPGDRSGRRVRCGGAVFDQYFASSERFQTVSFSDIFYKYHGVVSDRFSADSSDRQISNKRKPEIRRDGRIFRRLYDVLDLRARNLGAR